MPPLERILDLSAPRSFACLPARLFVLSLGAAGLAFICVRCSLFSTLANGSISVYATILNYLSSKDFASVDAGLVEAISLARLTYSLSAWDRRCLWNELTMTISQVLPYVRGRTSCLENVVTRRLDCAVKRASLFLVPDA